MKRTLYTITLLAALSACQNNGSSSAAYQNQVSHLLDFHQTIQRQDQEALAREIERLNAELENGDSADTRLQLALLASQQQLLAQQQQQQVLRQQIEELSAQIEALTAIEQQINRRGRQQENGQ